MQKQKSVVSLSYEKVRFGSNGKVSTGAIWIVKVGRGTARSGLLRQIRIVGVGTDAIRFVTVRVVGIKASKKLGAFLFDVKIIA